MGKKFAAFDFDGTLIRWQLYHAVVDKLAQTGLLGEDGKQRLRKSRMAWKRREHPEAFKEYEDDLIRLYESALDTLSVEDFDKSVEQVIKEYKDQVYTYTRDLAKDLKKQGYFLLAISGSHEELVEKVAQHYGFDAWVGTKYDRAKDKFSGRKFVASQDKRAILDRLIQQYDLSSEQSFAIGDSGSDIAMLKAVDQPIAFNPDRKLFKAAQNYGWDIVIERKNVVYRLEHKDGSYLLA